MQAADNGKPPAGAAPAARLLQPRLVEKVWGRDVLPPPFIAPQNTRIGEIWFEPPPELGELLVKYLFTSEKLSVQVHPSDANALPSEAGKEECWLILDAQPGARLAIGFDEAIEPARIEAAARDGSIEQMLTWHEAQPGDIFYLPAGTVHAIGPGLALLEVQQNSDTTFRLYDYGRPRELHLERAMAVADCAPYDAKHKGTIASRGQTLIDGKHFRLDRVEGAPSAVLAGHYRTGLLALPLRGEIALDDSCVSERISGHLQGGHPQPVPASAGECLYASSIDALDFSRAEVTLLIRPA